MLMPDEWCCGNILYSVGMIDEARELAKRNIEAVKRAFAAMFDVLLKQECKIDWAIRQKPDAAHKYIHARYCPKTLNEYYEEWGNKQNDAIGAFLFKIGDLYRKGIAVIRNSNDLRILQKLVHYLESIEYWHDKDHGMWEENEEIHASSVGACIAGLKAVSNLVDVPEWLIEKGQEILNWLLPRESETKEVDLALLSLIYPYNVVNEKQRRDILSNVEKHLVRERGLIRYIGDSYYNNGKEAEWCFGFPWLARIYKDIGNMEKYKHYLLRTIQIMNGKKELPELYFGGSAVHNENTPLGWAQAMFLCALT